MTTYISDLVNRCPLYLEGRLNGSSVSSFPGMVVPGNLTGFSPSITFLVILIEDFLPFTNNCLIHDSLMQKWAVFFRINSHPSENNIFIRIDCFNSLRQFKGKCNIYFIGWKSYHHGRRFGHKLRALIYNILIIFDYIVNSIITVPMGLPITFIRKMLIIKHDIQINNSVIYALRGKIWSQIRNTYGWKWDLLERANHQKYM